MYMLLRFTSPLVESSALRDAEKAAEMEKLPEALRGPFEARWKQERKKRVKRRKKEAKTEEERRRVRAIFEQARRPSILPVLLAIAKIADITASCLLAPFLP